MVNLIFFLEYDKHIYVLITYDVGNWVLLVFMLWTMTLLYLFIPESHISTPNANRLQMLYLHAIQVLKESLPFLHRDCVFVVRSTVDLKWWVSILRKTSFYILVSLVLDFILDLFWLWSGAYPDSLLAYNFVRGFVGLLRTWVLWLMFGISFGIVDDFSDNDLI